MRRRGINGTQGSVLELPLKVQIRIVVTGGGSSGHISPALAIIQALRQLAQNEREGWEPVFLYVGGTRGPEKQLVEAEKIEFAGIATGKLRRYLSVENLTDLFRIPLGVAQAAHAIARFRPHVLLSTGGYVAVPPVLAAKLLRVPVVIHEQTVQLGLANRITARFANHIAVGFPSAMEELPAQLRARAGVTGNPVRPAIFSGDARRAVEWAGFSVEDDGLPIVYATGGSQGARIINRAIEEVLPRLLEKTRLIHQCGRQPAGEEQDFDRLSRADEQLPGPLRRRYHLVHFIGSEINDVFAAADLVAGRSGAGTVTELCSLGKPALYIPLVPTGGDEQTRNARMCEGIGAAVILPQSELTGERLLHEVTELLADNQRLKQMGDAARTLARPQAAQEIASLVVGLARQHQKLRKEHVARPTL